VNPKRLYLAVAACAVLVYIGALWNKFALDDMYIVVLNRFVREPGAWWRAFGEPYWAGNLTGALYRPLVIACFALDWLVDGSAWFHAVNIVWHAGASVVVAALARRWAGWQAGLVAGVLFAVHPVHVEAVANVVGRNELMAACFTLLALYAALERQSVGWCAAALALGVLSKENAAVAPALIVWAWLLGIGRPERRKLAAFVASWVLVGAAYGLARWAVLHPFAGWEAVAPVFKGESPLTVRLTAIAALADVVRLLLFPLHLRVDYSPIERTAVRSPFEPRFLLGLALFIAWAALVRLAWRRGGRVEALGLGWIAITYLPVANLLFPVAIVVAERALYLPSAGLAVALGALLGGLHPRRLAAAVGIVFVLGGLRTALRVPVWRDNRAVALSMLRDAPWSYRSHDHAAWELYWAGRTERALDAWLLAGRIFDRDQGVFLAGAMAAYSLGRPKLADSLLTLANAACTRCPTAYRNMAGAARLRGDSLAADSLLARAARLPTP
jgi:protein O-mannosyl-transferase